MKNRTRVISTAFVLLAALLTAVGLLRRRESLPPAHPNVVLISIDTCRADYLSCYGFPRQTTPNIDALAREGVLFQNVIAPVARTLPSHSSMMTGTRPPYHGVHDNSTYRLDESNLTLAEILKEQGYTTGAVVGAFVLNQKFGLAQGFESYDANFESPGSTPSGHNERRAGEVNRLAKQWLWGHIEGPFFLFLHYFDPHYPYQPPPPFSTNSTGRAGERVAYAGEISYADQCVGEIKAELVRLGVYDSTLIVITSDHGEGLFEHGESTHGWFAYHSTTRVPLVMKLPGIGKARKVEDKVALIDLAPTILDRVGVGIPEQMQGRSLDSYLEGRRPEQPKRFIYSESLFPTSYGCSSLLALENRQWKYIQSTKPELYDLILDPFETKNLVNSNVELARSLRDRLETLLTEETRTRVGSTVLAWDSETVKRLEGLGYVDGGGRTGFEFETDKEDPKDFHPYYEKILVANYESKHDLLESINVPNSAGGTDRMTRSAAVKRSCRDVLAQRPDMIKAHTILASIAGWEGNLEEAAAHYAEVLRIAPNSPGVYLDWGDLRKRQGRMEEATSLYRKAVEIATTVPENDSNVDRALESLGRLDPYTLRARLSLGDALARQEKMAQAAEQYREAVRIDPNHAKAHVIIGVDLAARGEHAEAMLAFERALRIKPGYKPALRAMEHYQAPPGAVPGP